MSSNGNLAEFQGFGLLETLAAMRSSKVRTRRAQFMSSKIDRTSRFGDLTTTHVRLVPSELFRFGKATPC